MRQIWLQAIKVYQTQSKRCNFLHGIRNSINSLKILQVYGEYGWTILLALSPIRVASVMYL